jgi:thiamine-monophosphate kinase
VSSHQPLGPGREFDAVRALVLQWGSRATGIGDDAALVDVPDGERLVVSTDTSVEFVHFRREWLSAAEIGWRATTAALSDLAAMGARPLAVLTALVVPDGWRGELGAIGDGIAAAVEAASTHIVGGDLSTGSELSLCVTVLGSSKSPLTRGGARPGESLWVTGALGGPATALRSLLDGTTPAAAARGRFAHPSARVREALWLAARGATAAIDISDGLIADARHMAAASGVALAVSLDNVPRFGECNPADAASSGEEYELLIAGPGMDCVAFTREFGLALTRIGEVGPAEGAPGVIVTSGGARVEFTGGYDHFSA